MSTWTEVTGIIVCDWCSWSYPDKDKVKEDIIARKNKINNILKKNLPSGSEGPIKTQYLGNNYNIIVITGSLRDFDSTDIQEKIAPWWDNIINELDFIRQAVMSCTSCK